MSVVSVNSRFLIPVCSLLSLLFFRHIPTLLHFAFTYLSFLFTFPFYTNCNSFCTCTTLLFFFPCFVHCIWGSIICQENKLNNLPQPCQQQDCWKIGQVQWTTVYSFHWLWATIRLNLNFSIHGSTHGVRYTDSRTNFYFHKESRENSVPEMCQER